MTVTPTDVAVALGRAVPDPDSTEAAQWDMWIGDAEMLIQARLGDLNELDQPKLAYVVREAVVAHVRRPDDATQVSVAIDDASTSRMYRTSRGRITILDEWWDLLSPSDRTSGAFSIRPSRSANPHLPWCSLMFNGASCSCGVDIAGYPIFEGADLS